MFSPTAQTQAEKGQPTHGWAFGGLKTLWIYLS